MDWSVILAALLGVFGVVVGTYLTTRLRSYETYSDWRRDHLYELYTELVPILYRLRGAPNLNLAMIRDEMRALIPRVEILCSEEAREYINGVYKLATPDEAPWYLTEEQRLEWKPPPRPLGSISATRQHVDQALAAMQRDLKSPTTSRTKRRGPLAVFKSWRRARAMQDRQRRGPLVVFKSWWRAGTKRDRRQP